MRIYSLLMSMIISHSIWAQPTHQRPSSGTERLAAFTQHQRLSKLSVYKRVQWRNVGPDNISGRCTDVWGIPGNKAVIYAAFATGGLWKTTDTGRSWKPLFDRMPTQNFGTMALYAKKPDIIYAGTGEANIFRASMPGTGVYKSTNGGKTWQHLGLENTGTIARVVIHPDNPNIVYVAASGNEWSYNADRGLYQTTDGGKTWKKILYTDEKTGCIDVVMDPSNADILYASMWNRIRKRWSDPVPEDGDYIYKSTDGGKTWKKLTEGLPDTKNTGRVGLAVAASNPDVVYAFVDNHENKREVKAGELDPYGRPRDFVAKGVEVYRSGNKGESWSKMSMNDDFMERLCGTYGWVFGQIRVNPRNENSIVIMGVPMAKSNDGGKSWQYFRPDSSSKADPLHGDNHALWIDPTDTSYIINGDDGGVAVSYNAGRDWKNFYRSIPTTQFYNIAYDNSSPFNIIGSVQDEGSFMASIDNTFGVQKGTKPWQYGPGGEGVIHAVDPVDGNIIYTSSFYGRLLKADLRQSGRSRTRNITLPQGAGEETHRGEWLAYTLLSPHDRFTVYHGMQYIFRSRDSGASWQRISPDLSYNNKSKMGKTPYAVNHQAITAIDESPLKKGLLYAGTDDGRVWRSLDDGKNWTETVLGLPVNVHVSRIVASRYNEARVYLTMSDRREDNITPHIFVSNDYGTTWESIAGNLPASPVNVIREDPEQKDVLYCGTDMGVYMSRTGGFAWSSLQANLPAVVSVQDLFVHPRDRKLVIATYGRGIWVLDNMKPLEK